MERVLRILVVLRWLLLRGKGGNIVTHWQESCLEMSPNAMTDATPSIIRPDSNAR